MNENYKTFKQVTGSEGEKIIICGCSRAVVIEGVVEAVCPSCGTQYEKVGDWVVAFPPALSVHIRDGVGSDDKLGG
jgi:hypothetical protein